MKNHLIRAAGLAFALTLVPLLADAQKDKRGMDPPANGCRAHGVRCLFGRAGGCVTVCPPEKNPVCIGAWCLLGFPIPAQCYCEGGDAT
jgi:hypothetical protein